MLVNEKIIDFHAYLSAVWVCLYSYLLKRPFVQMQYSFNSVPDIKEI